MKYTLSLVLLLHTASLFAQNSIQSVVNNDPSTIILETFLSGDCFDLSNMKITTFGDSTQVGLFYSGGSSIGIDSGIILSTGHVADIVGPNSQDNTSGEYPQNPLPDSIRNIMDILTHNSTYEVVMVEFDFVPTVANIEFEYVFASEEYCEFVGEDFFDTFGFIISGPGIDGPFPNGGENIALIPGTNDFVNINNINHQLNNQYYIDNTLTSIPRPCNLLAEPVFQQEIEFDGFTVPLKAIANVIPCETYHMQLIIADVFQRDRDSGVFLAANSFKAGQAVNVSTGINALGDGYNTVYEGCSEPYFTFTRANADVTDSVVVYFTVSAQSGASIGLDFAILPDSIIIPSGEMSYILPVEIFADNLEEGIEEIILDVVGSCSCETTSINMFIQDPIPLSVDSTNFSTCSGVETVIEPHIISGAPPFSYQWENGSTASSLAITPTESRTFQVTVTDLCGEEVVSEIYLTSFSPSAIMSGEGYSCNNEINSNIDVTLTGFGNWELVYAINGQNDTISNILQQNISIPTNIIGTYELISVSADDCPGIVDGMVQILNTDIQLNSNSTDNSCFNANDGTIHIAASNGTAPYSFQWDNLNNGAITNTNMAIHNVSNLSNGTFEVSITDANDCIAVTSFTISEPSVLSTSVENVVDVNCNNPSQGSIDLSTQGGTAPYSYEWNNQSDTENLNNLDGGTYLVTVSDHNNCNLSLEVTVAEDLETPIIQLEVDDVIDCATAELEVSSVGSSLGNQFEYQWTTNDGNIQTPNHIENIIVNQAGNYQLQIINTNNFCESNATIEVTDNFNYPISEAGEAITLNCQETSLPLNASASSSGNSFNYQWLSPENHPIDNVNSLMPSIQEAGTYYLNVTNVENGCTSVDSVEVFEDTALPIVQLNIPEILDCNTPSVSLDANGSSQGNEFEYTWQGPVGSVISGSNTLNPSINSPGQYSLAILNINNWCESNASIEVMMDTTSPVIILQEPGVLSCSQTEVTINSEGSDSGANFEYQWTSNDDFIIENEDSSSPTMVEAGIYELLLQNLENGCSSTADIEIEIDTLSPALFINLPDTINCDQLSVELDLYISSSTQNAIQWSTASGNIISGATTDLAIVDAAGTYTVTVSDLLNDCLATAQTTVIVDTIAPIAIANVANILDCNNPSTLIDGSGSSEGDFLYHWTGPDHANIENGQNLIAEVDEAGIYTLLITNPNNFCTTSLNVMVNQNIEEPIVNIMPSEILDCGTTSTTITAEVDQNNYNFHWQAEDGSTIEEGNIHSITLDFPGWISLLVTNPDNGCFTESSTIIEQDITIPVIDAGEGTILNCVEPTAILNGTNSSTGNTFSYQWTTSDGQIISFANSLQPLIQGAGLYILEVINTQNECSNQDSVVVSENIPVDAIVDASEILCIEDVAEIQISGVQGGEGPYLYSINHGDSFSNFAYFTNLEAGIYQIIVQDINGCEWQSEIAIEAPNELEVQLDERAFLTLGQDYPLFLQLNIPEEEVASVQWSPAEGLSCTDCLSPIATPLKTTIYRVEVLSINGCKDQTNIRLFVHRDTKVYIPNAFSPNNDGVNDTFTAYSDPTMVNQIKNMRIFDRWGNTLFEKKNFAANDPSLGWDGRFKGSLMNQSVFAYWIEVELIDGTSSTFKGDVSLIK